MPLSRNPSSLLSIGVAALLGLASASARAADATSEYPMPISPKAGAPAIDLVGMEDRDAAREAVERGVDLSEIDPVPNITWQPGVLPISNAEKFAYPPEHSQVLFLNDISPNGMYRGQVEYLGRPYRLVIDPNGHQAIMTAALLRRIGYPVDMPKRYEELSLRFESLEKLKSFVDGFAFETESSRDRWLKKTDEKNLVVTLQDVNLEYPRIDVPQYYNGKINTDWVAGHRAARALIVPLMLLDVNLGGDSGSVNTFAWEFSRVLSESIVLSHDYVSAFKETTYADAKWAARKIARLGRDGKSLPSVNQAIAELKAIIDLAGYPEDVAALLLQKVIARRNHMVHLFGLEAELGGAKRDAKGKAQPTLAELPYDVKYTHPEWYDAHSGTTFRRGEGVKNGEAVRETYPHHAERFSIGDPESPLRWAELKHYVKMEGLAQGIKALTNTINQELQFKSVRDGAEAHQQDLLDAILEHFKQHPNEPYVMPLKPWVKPLYGLNLNASRSVVTGTYYGSEGKAQLVDNFVVGASVGAFGGVDGRKWLQNVGFGGSVSYQRTYTHVRPILSLQAVKNEKWKNLFVPGFLKSTSKILSWKLLQRKYAEFRGEFESAQRAYHAALKANPEYAKRLEPWRKWKAVLAANDGKAPAGQTAPPSPMSVEGLPKAPDVKALFKKTIDQELADSRAIPEIPDDLTNPPAELPEDLEDTVVLSTLKGFLEDVRENEVYTITDSYVSQVTPQVQIPLTTFMGSGVVDLVGKDLYNKVSPSVGVSVTGQWAILKRLMFLRKGDQFQIYDTKMNTRAFGGAMNFSAWIELAKIAANKKKGTADTEAMMLDLTSVTDEDKAKDEKLAKDRKKLLRVLADLLFKNELDRAEEMAPPYALHHELKGKTKSAKILMWNWANYAETHKVRVTPPADKDHPFDPRAKARTLYSARKMNLSGKNPYGLVGQVLSKAVGVNGLLDPGTNQNPSGTFLGSANWSQVRAEADVTPGEKFTPTLILEDYYSGWLLAKEKLLKILDRMQAEVNDLNIRSPIFRRDMFASTTQLQAYEIRSSVILYPKGVEKVEAILFQPTRRQLLLKLLEAVDPEDYRKRCRSYFEDKKIEPELAEYEKASEKDRKKIWNRCIQPWMRRVMRHVRNKVPPRDRKERYTEWLSSTMYIFNQHLDLSRFLNQIGTENFFFQVRVSGFRKGDENAQNKFGQTDYVTDTIGTIKASSLGPFRDLNAYTNGEEWSISDYELQARYFGDGL